MKLTKAQRLFMKAGEINEKMSYYKLIFKATKAPGFPSHIRQLRSRRKELIREALRAYELEIGDAFSSGHALMRGLSEDAPMVIEEEDQTIIF